MYKTSASILLPKPTKEPGIRRCGLRHKHSDLNCNPSYCPSRSNLSQADLSSSDRNSPLLHRRPTPDDTFAAHVELLIPPTNVAQHGIVAGVSTQCVVCVVKHGVLRLLRRQHDPPVMSNPISLLQQAVSNSKLRCVHLWRCTLAAALSSPVHPRIRWDSCTFVGLFLFSGLLLVLPSADALVVAAAANAADTATARHRYWHRYHYLRRRRYRPRALCRCRRALILAWICQGCGREAQSPPIKGCMHCTALHLSG